MKSLTNAEAQRKRDFCENGTKLRNAMEKQEKRRPQRSRFQHKCEHTVFLPLTIKTTDVVDGDEV